MDFNKIIAKLIIDAIQNQDDINLTENELEEYIEIPKEKTNGDYAFPCFRLAKILKKAPNMIADELKEKINLENSCIEKIESVSGYLNF